MYLQPMPTSILTKEGAPFFLCDEVKIILSKHCNREDFQAAKLLKQSIQKLIHLNLELKKSYREQEVYPVIRLIKQDGIEEEGYHLNITERQIEIKSTTSKGLFYGVQTFIQIIKNKGVKLSPLEIKDSPYFKVRGYYHDVTRGKVPTFETLIQLVDKLSHYKINQLQLYIEHTFAYQGMSEVWYDKDPLTAEEILQLDEYCHMKHVELVPSIAVFGHLYEVLRSESYKDLSEIEDEHEFSFFDRMAHHTLDVSNEKSLRLAEEMISQFVPLFSSSKFNINGDETFDLAKGKSCHLLENTTVGELYVNFLNELIAIVKRHDKEVLFWGDVILRYPHLISKIDSNVTCLNWNYYYLVEETDTKIISEGNIPQYVCPGVAGWNHFMNLMDKGYENIRRMVSYGVKYGADGVLTTDWGDYGHINLLANSMPLMIYAASSSWNPADSRSMDEQFHVISLLEYGDDSGQLIHLLEELSHCQKITWYEIVKWKEKFHTDMGDELRLEYQNFNVQEIRSDYEKAVQIENQLVQYLPYIKEEQQLDFQEFLISAKAIILLNDFALHLLKNEFLVANSHPVQEPKQLAEKIELWFTKYQLIWRKRNKESELSRINEVIKYICHFLRKL